jgi:hypothetical protein
LEHAKLRIGATGGEIVVVGASREAADDFVRQIAAARRATFGMHRFSFPQLASRLTRMEAARRGTTPAASLMVDALTARACFEAADTGLRYFAPGCSDTRIPEGRPQNGHGTPHGAC